MFGNNMLITTLHRLFAKEFSQDISELELAAIPNIPVSKTNRAHFSRKMGTRFKYTNKAWDQSEDMNFVLVGFNKSPNYSVIRVQNNSSGLVLHANFSMQVRTFPQHII